ncbi:hypothetical protein [Haloarchaeobius salinus]|uniref:hypothetical protein n=1 Tax=Haloarchaeobius salinus TaxID=1198298 RepID=UPI00210EB73A|nr:hypothetical protein [Haloarchaeobius salinus]
MSGDSTPTDRRTVLRGLAATGAIAGSPLVAAKTRDERDRRNVDPRLSLRELAVEIAFHPERDLAAITTLGLGDGYQVYLVADVDARTDVVHTRRDLEQLSRATVGVHGIHWTDARTLRYSRDGSTIERSLAFETRRGGVVTTTRATTTVSEQPLPVRATSGPSTAVDIPYPIDCKSGGNVCCTDVPFVNDWCVRVTGNDSGHSPECAGSNPPPMPHGHFAIFPEGNYRGGINIWIGKNGNCIWVGEEHASNWCTRVCGPNGGLPSLADLRDAFEEAINQAADAAGIAVPAIVVTALAYYLAASTLAPPTGVPLV